MISVSKLFLKSYVTVLHVLHIENLCIVTTPTLFFAYSSSRLCDIYLLNSQSPLSVKTLFSVNSHQFKGIWTGPKKKAGVVATQKLI